jgi:hypothetical protein
MAHINLSAVALGVSMMLVSSITAQEQLSRKAAQTLDQAAQAYQAGRMAEALQTLQAFLKSSSPVQVRLADERIRQSHGMDKTVVELAADARVQLVLQGAGGKVARPGSVELPAAQAALDEKLTSLLTPIKEEMASELPARLPDDQADHRAVTVEGLLNQTVQVELLLTHLKQLSERSPGPPAKQQKAKAQQPGGHDFIQEQKDLQELRDRLMARLMELNLVRLEGAMLLALDQTAGFDKRMHAMTRASDSLTGLHAHWSRYKQWKEKHGGYDPKSEERWLSQEEQLKSSAGPLITKVYHFSEGTRWWLRGRYGKGSAAGGLVKVLPAGLRQDQTLKALTEYDLLMPQPIPKPQDPLTMPGAYPIGRRHLALWQWETRGALVAWPGKVMPSSKLAMAPPPGSPPRIVYLETKPEELRLAQLVGYVEYSAALWHFENLLKSCTPAEQRALEDMLGNDDRFTVHSGLSSPFDQLDPSSALRLPTRPPDPRSKRPNERRGLSWATALARVELGAMRAGHAWDSASPIRRTDNARRNAKAFSADDRGPFDKLPPTPFDTDAFLEILLDGARQHYYDLRRDVPQGADLNLMFVNQAMLLQRRLAVAYEMTEAFGRYAGNSLTQSQRNELGQWLIWLETQEGLMRAKADPLANDPRFDSGVNPQSGVRATKSEPPKAPDKGSSTKK